MNKVKRKIFMGSSGWLIFWIIVCWPIAIWYFFGCRKIVELKVID